MRSILVSEQRVSMSKREKRERMKLRERMELEAHAGVSMSELYLSADEVRDTFRSLHVPETPYCTPL